jgi:TRAP transporter TAXI family solute receptor
MKKFVSVVLTLVMLLVVMAYAPSSQLAMASAADPQRVFVSLGTASLGGNFFTMGAAIAAVLMDKLPGYRVTAQATGGSASNVFAVHEKELDMAVCQATSIAAGIRGTDQFVGTKIDDVRTLVNWNATPIHILASRAIKAKNITDLAQARFECITPGDGIEITTKMWTNLFGIDGTAKLEYSGNRVQATSRFKTGGVDAILDATGLGAAWMTDVIGDGSKYELLSLTDEQINAIIAKASEYSKMVIPAGTYGGQTEEAVTAGNWTTLLVHASMNDDVAYNITKTINENKDLLVRGHSFFRDLDPKNIVDACVAPLHPGAERYYKEIGVIK